MNGFNQWFLLNSKGNRMIDLKTIVESHLFEKNLYQQPEFIFSLQIDPALHYILKSLAQDSSNVTLDENTEYSNEELFNIVKKSKILESQHLEAIEEFLNINQKVKKLLSNNDRDIEKENILLNKADNYLQQLKSLAKRIIAISSGYPV